MIQLLVKEWLGLRPFAILLGAVWIIGAMMSLMLDFPDEYPLQENLLSQASLTASLMLVFAVLLTQGLITREKQEHTIDFLDSLPLSRFSIFWAKWIMAFLILISFLALLVLEALFYDFLSRTSLSEGLPWRSLGIWCALQSLFCMVALSLGLLLSYLRWLALLALAGLFWGVWWMMQKEFSAAEWINPFNLVAAPESADEPWLIPWKHVQVQAGLGLVFTLLALLLFLLRESALTRMLARLATTRIFRAGLSLCILAIPVAWIAFFVQTADSLEDLGEEEALGSNEVLAAEARKKLQGRQQILHHQTGHFQFSYRKHQRKELKPLFPEADATYTTVADFFEVPDSKRESMITVDLCHPLQEHFAGLAFWKKIRMTTTKDGTLEHHLAVLGHEVTHVLINLLTERRASEDFSSIRWFHEGLATYVEYRFFRSEEEILQANRSLALASIWDQIHFEELIDDEELSRERDALLAYSAGYLWCQALVSAYGDDAPARLLQSIAKPSLGRQETSLARWRQYCQDSGFDLERTRTHFRRLLAELRQKHAEECARFPRPATATVSRGEKSILLRPELPEDWRQGVPKGAFPVCRIRPGAGAPIYLQRSARLKDGTFSFEARHFLKPSFEYSLGWHTGEWSGSAVWGEWHTAKVPR